MDWATLAAFLAMVAIGTYVQAVTGFAMALVLMALVAAFGLLPIPEAAAVTALLTATMAAAFLHGQWRLVDRRLVWPLLVCNGPGVLGGLALLTWLGAREMEVVRLGFGLFAVAAGVSVILRPVPRPTRSPRWHTGVFGGLGGVFAGLFAVGGPVMAYHLYRQPVPLADVRATLAVLFLVGNAGRSVVVGAAGDLDGTTLTLFVAGLPVVFAFTALGRRFPPSVTDRTMRRLSSVLVVAVGAFVGGMAAFSLGSP
ncbi:MAG: sulfite exporter TauE/SafE family protein [Gammaproteobacteria bacterium]|nr:sulfite exporter TauE/SafE family protein [Gammaproteobacteria bacterium]